MVKISTNNPNLLQILFQGLSKKRDQKLTKLEPKNDMDHWYKKRYKIRCEKCGFLNVGPYCINAIRNRTTKFLNKLKAKNASYAIQ